MTTSVQLTDQELAELQELTKQNDPAQAIRAAVHNFVRHARRMQLKQMSGVVRIQDTWQALEAAEMEAQLKNGVGPD